MGENMSYQVKLDVFEGPLDLLLHLINKSKVNIEDISIAEITQQYLDYLNEMQRFDIEIASEFLVMASELLYIKSCSLIRREIREQQNEEEDLQHDLILRLLEYKKYKEASSKLHDWELAYSNVYYKLPEEYVDVSDDIELFSNVSKNDLLNAFKSLLVKKRSMVNPTTIHKIQKDSISIKERIKQLKNQFQNCSEIYFFDLFEEYAYRWEIIVTFLALLEMLKDGMVELRQSKPFEDILVRKRYNKSWMKDR